MNYFNPNRTSDLSKQCTLNFVIRVPAYYFFMTLPFIINLTLLFEALELTVIDLLKDPTMFVLYLTLITPSSPGGTGSLVH
jgi:hypothetical protein